MPDTIICSCACHGHNHLDRACDVDGGCGHLHRDVQRVGRCVLDGDRPRAAVVGRLCRSHVDQLADMLDPRQGGQVFAKPGEHPTAPGISVLYGRLDAEPVRRSLDSQVASGAFKSTPPGRLDVMALRDSRTVPGDGPWPVLATLHAIAAQLDVRDINGHPAPIPRSVEAVCAWLHVRRDTLAQAAWIDDAWHDLRALHRQLLGVHDLNPPRPLGPCWKRVDADGKLTEGGPFECAAPLYLPPQPLKGMDELVVLPGDLRCSACGGHYDRAEIVRVGRQRKAAS